MEGPLLVYDSRTGNVKRFIKKLDNVRVVFLREIEKVTEPFVLVTYTDKQGEVPATTQRFLQENHNFLLGVASSGNRRWKNTFGMAADIISQDYQVPLLLKFELSGNLDTIKTFIERVGNIEYT